MANRWGKKMETVTGFIFLGSKITADGDCSHEIKSCLFLGRKAMTKLDSILKSRDITLLTQVYIIKAMVFPVVMYVYPPDPESRVDSPAVFGKGSRTFLRASG